MALVLANRVKDTTTTTGTGAITLSGTAPAGYQNFSVIGNGNTTYYTIISGTAWEVGIGTYTSAGTTLSRDTVLSSSAGGTTKISLTGTSDVFVTYPAERTVYSSGTTYNGIPDPGTSGNVVTSDGTSWTSKAPSTTTLTASGSISAGAPVIQNTDGTVSAVTGTVGSTLLGSIYSTSTNIFAASGPYGAAYDPYLDRFMTLFYYNNAYSVATGSVSGNGISVINATVSLGGGLGLNTSGDIVYDPANQRFIAFYTNSNSYPSARVISIAGENAQLHGAEVVISSVTAKVVKAVYDPVSRKIIVTYNASNNTYGVVGTATATSISFGTPVIAFAATSSVVNNRGVSITYDTANSKAVIAGVNSSQTISGIVGTVSGTSISFGTATTFGSTTSGACGAISAAFDQNAGRCLFAYKDGVDNTAYGIVGTVSGTSISFGTRVQIQLVTPVTTSIAYDPNVKKSVVVYNSNTNYYVVATISGTSVSFASQTTVSTTSGTDAQSFVSSTYSPQNATPVIFFYTSTLSRYTGTVVNTATTTNTNLTNNNFLGFSVGSYTNGQSATVALVGTVNTSQSGLVAGEYYYVQPDGALGLAPGPINVYAGFATSSSTIVIGG